MSIEQAMADLTAALRENTAALSGAAKSSKKSTAKEETANPTQTATTATAAVTSTPSQTSAPASVTLKEAADVFLKVAEMNRDTAVSIIGKYGASKLSEVKPDKLAAVLADCQAALAPAATLSASSLV